MIEYIRKHWLCLIIDAVALVTITTIATGLDATIWEIAALLIIYAVGSISGFMDGLHV